MYICEDKTFCKSLTGVKNIVLYWDYWITSYRIQKNLALNANKDKILEITHERKFCLRVTLRVRSKLSKHVSFREKDRPTQFCAKIKVLRKFAKISCPTIFHKNASFVLHIGDTFFLVLLEPSTNVDICFFARKFIANNFAKISIMFSQEILETYGNGFSWKTNITSP